MSSSASNIMLRCDQFFIRVLNSLSGVQIRLVSWWREVQYDLPRRSRDQETTSFACERATNEIPHLPAHLLRNLDKNGIVRLGSLVEAGDVLVGKLTPQMEEESSYTPEDRLLRAILNLKWLRWLNF